MYTQYNRNITNQNIQNRCNRYPSYGYFDDNYEHADSPWSDVSYSGDRLYPHFWEKDDFSRFRRRAQKPASTKPPPVAPTEELARALKVTDVNVHAMENAKAHHTNLYKCVEKGQPVVRRGDNMLVTITFDREYDNATNNATFEFSIGKEYSQPKGTHAIMKLIETKQKQFKPEEWGASLVGKKGNALTIQIHIPVNCIIGPWNMRIKTTLEGKDEKGEKKLYVFSYECQQDIFILFNPWCQGDGVYMPETNLKEYILNESGVLFNGCWKDPESQPWFFAQFQDEVLDAALYILLAGFGGKPAKAMADPTSVSRTLVKMINADDDDGILVGNWSGNYEDGTKPDKWDSSRLILRQFMENKESVKYGQCAAFSGVTTTVCRALGIPCRSVTVFAAAQDSEGSNTIDKFFDYDNQPLEFLNTDRIWDYHIWNEVWIARPDLEENGMKGWQVIDATPLEKSSGEFTCGPCPVAAVKRGLCNIPYDAGFVFSAVNADEIHWTRYPDLSVVRRCIITDSVGKAILTKDPEDPEKAMNILHEYKFPEGSAEERKAVMMAQKTARYQRDAYSTQTEKEDIVFNLQHADTLMLGQNLEVFFIAKNISKTARKVQYTKISVSPKTYTGQVGRAFFKEDFSEFELKPGQDKKFSIKLSISDYSANLVEGSFLYIVGTAFVPRINDDSPQQTVFQGHEFKFKMPRLEVEVCDICSLFVVKCFYDPKIHFSSTQLNLLEQGSSTRL